MWLPAAPARGQLVLFGGAAIVVSAAMTAFVRALAAATDGSGRGLLSGMPLSDMPEMFVAIGGLLLVVVGTAVRRDASPRRRELSGRRRALVAVIGTAALTIDISKTSTLGFVIPGMRAEYGLSPGTAALLAVAGLSGTAIGAVLFGLLADRIGCRWAYLLATLGFTATSMCGCMPSFAGNLVMCFAMGTAVGGLAPLLIALLTDVIAAEVRGSVVVALAVLGTAVGYLVAAGSVLWLEPTFGWRVLWLIGAPTGLVLVVLAPWIPEWVSVPRNERPDEPNRVQALTLTGGVQRIYATLIGVLTFGLTTWVPSLARSGGLAVGTANLLLTVSAVVLIPCAVVLMLLYRRFGPVAMVVGLAGVTAALLLTLTVTGAARTVSWICAGALVLALFSVNVMGAIFLPVAADLAASARRSRTTGTVSLCNRLGGLCGPLLLAGLVSSMSDVLVAVTVLALLCAAIAGYVGRRHSLNSLTREEVRS